MKFTHFLSIVIESNQPGVWLRVLTDVNRYFLSFGSLLSFGQP